MYLLVLRFFLASIVHYVLFGFHNSEPCTRMWGILLNMLYYMSEEICTFICHHCGCVIGAPAQVAHVSECSTLFFFFFVGKNARPFNMPVFLEPCCSW